MSDPDLELRNLLKQAMHEAMPDPATEERVLGSLLSRLPQVGYGPGDVGDVTSNTPPTTDAGLLKSSGLLAGKATKTLVGALLSVTVGGAIAATVASEFYADKGAVNATSTSATTTQAQATDQANSPKIQQPATSAQEVVRESDGRTEKMPPKGRSEAKSTVTAAEPVDSLALELSLIHRAKEALTRDDLSRAIELVEEHARAHPSGQLIVERRAIEVMALCREGDPRAEDKLRRLVREFELTPALEAARASCENSRASGESGRGAE